MIQTFDDFLLVPSYSNVEREEVNINTDFFDLILAVPVISAPMDTITGKEMLHVMWQNGGLGVHHRYCTKKELLEAAKFFFGAIAVSPSLGLDLIEDLISTNSLLIVALDVAHGDTKRNLDFCEKMSKMGAKKIISGNIISKGAAQRYLDVGVKYMRVGIGSGSVCTTRLVTGCGYPQASAIQDVAEIKTKHPEVRIISDGGHRNTGDIVKALALGADFVMLGSMLSGTKEALSQTNYRGMASESALSPRKDKFFVEGIEKEIEPKGSVSDVLYGIKNAIIQACYYTGSHNIEGLRNCHKIVLNESSRRESFIR